MMHHHRRRDQTVTMLDILPCVHQHVQPYVEHLLHMALAFDEAFSASSAPGQQVQSRSIMGSHCSQWPCHGRSNLASLRRPEELRSTSKTVDEHAAPQQAFNLPGDTLQTDVKME